MSNARAAAAAARSVALRTPLARVQLAASRLEREAVTPAVARLVASISDAVAELDRGIADLLGVLVPPAQPVTDEDVAAALEVLRQRVAPSLCARGVEWTAGAGHAGPVPGNASLVRESAVALVREAAAALGAGGRVRLDLAEAPDRLELRLSLTGGRAGAPGPGGFEASRALALRRGGGLDWDGAAGRATLWLPRGEAACVAS